MNSSPVPWFGGNVIFLLSLSFSYGGPGSQDVNERWKLDWEHYMASNRDFVVAQMDVRGSGFQGDTFKHAVFHRLGQIEAKDSMHVIR